MVWSRLMPSVVTVSERCTTRACDIDGCNVWKCAEPLLSTKQNSIRFRGNKSDKHPVTKQTENIWMNRLERSLEAIIYEIFGFGRGQRA